ncbi:hypothetical protein EUGRSUZ_L02067 [Eucalyptus grandis]|uniref:Uncharacterized protein n=1 Tax=Eucalyptus grandis TaxID=71139 RepID=A0A058ZTV5_EUCGR|nr:hypothetical protein EUGRSUZ_L02067 [Eucalyptus grandis]
MRSQESCNQLTIWESLRSKTNVPRPSTCEAEWSSLNYPVPRTISWLPSAPDPDTPELHRTNPLETSLPLFSPTFDKNPNENSPKSQPTMRKNQES